MKNIRLLLFRTFILAGLLTVCARLDAQYIGVSSSYTAEQLVKDIFIGQQNASCITVENVRVIGWDFGDGDLSYGYVYRNGSAFEIEEGILLSSGRISEAVGTYTGIQSASAPGWGGDEDLERGASINNTTNATVLEFDFISHLSNKISFEYMFLSEQYLRQDDPGTCGYTDGFAFLIRKEGEINYTNIAVIPNTNIPITSNNVRGAGGKCPPANEAYFGRFNPDNSPVSFNGQTAILTAKSEVIPGERYHIKLVIADQGNALYDSGVILKAGSFSGNIDLGEDRTIENRNPVCKEEYPFEIKTISGGSSYQWFKDGVMIPEAENQETYHATEPGNYQVKIVLSGGCRLEGSLTLENAPEPEFDLSPIAICDQDFDGSYSAVLSSFNSKIVTNSNQHLFTIVYYTDPNGSPIDSNSEFVFTQNPQTLYVKASAYGCAPETRVIEFFQGTKLGMNTPPVIDVCDDDLDGKADVDLSDYLSLITNEAGYAAFYYDNEEDAKQGGTSTVVTAQTINSNKTFYIRIEKAGFCANYVALMFNFKQPKKSGTLTDQIICKNATVVLDAGPGFDSYEWSTGETTSSVDVPVGSYWVKLGYNGCFYTQYVEVKEAEAPVIENVLINGKTITVIVSGGTPPYQYSLDNGPYQSSNVFSNLELGNHTVYVKSADGCSIVNKTFILIDIINVITPNNDGKNDVVDYSGLMSKKEPKFEVYDRYGKKIFEGDAKNKFIWDGKLGGRVLPTSTYWYILQWQEPGSDTPLRYTGWILLKNRN